MDLAPPSLRPFLVVVTGRPGSGKTTLAHSLARAIRCPALCRDEFKEGFVNTTGEVGTPGDEISLHIYGVFFDAITLLLRNGISLVAEAAFQHKAWAPKLEPIQEIAHLRIIDCVVDAQLARSRHVERGLADPERERYHHDRPVQAAREGRTLPVGEYEPPRLDVPTLRVDTSDGYRPDFEAIVAFVRKFARQE